MSNNLINKDYDLEFFYKKVIRLIFIYKFGYKNINNNFDIKIFKMFVRFNNIVELDKIGINKYIFFFWLITGKISKISNIFSVFRLGVEYFFINLEIVLLNLYNILNVLNILVNNLLIKGNNFKVNLNLAENKVNIIFKDKEMFSNFKIVKSLFIYNISESINFQMQLKKSNYFILNYIIKILNICDGGNT